jgi:serine/threonine protein kinase
MWTAPDIPKAPQLVLGRYRLLVKLGQGGMGDVYLAGTEGLGGVGRLVVIKRLRNMEDPQHVAMFLNEARIAKQLSHPNIVQTYEVGREEDSHLLIMEYLEGPTLWRLRRLAADRGGVPWPIGIEVVRSVLDGLHYAHELRAPDGKSLKIVHRDLSSENVIITQEGDCKILDFGIAKAADSVVQTQAGFVKGKLHTMPPEQLRGLPVDRRTDVFAAGVMLWEGLSGQSLWGNLGNIAISTRLVQGDIPPLRELEPRVPEELRQICETALCPQPEGRFESALAMKMALMDYAGRHDLVVTRAQVAAFVGPLFSEERERIDRIIRGQLEQQNPLRFSGVSPVPGLATEGLLGTPLPGSTPIRLTPGRSGGAPPLAPAPSATVKRAAMVGAALAVAGGLWLWQGRAPRPAEPAAQTRSPASEAATKYLAAAEQSLASRNYEYGRTMLAKARAAGATEADVNIRIERVHDALEVAALLADARAHLETQRWRAAGEAARRAYERQPANAEALELLNRARTSQQLADVSARSRPKSRESGRSRKASESMLAGRTPANADPPVVREPEPAPETLTIAEPAPPSRPEPAAIRALPDASPVVQKPAAPVRAGVSTAPVQRGTGAVFSPAPAKVAPPSLPRVYLPGDAEQLRRMCARVEAAVVALAGITPEYARGITGRFQAQVGTDAEIYPVAMYYFIVREAGLKHDNATAAAALATAQRTKAILVLKDLAAIDTGR